MKKDIGITAVENVDTIEVSKSRRDFMKNLALAGTVSAFSSWMPMSVQAGSSVRMGFIFVGPRNDYGYNQSHFEGKTAVAKQSGSVALANYRRNYRLAKVSCPYV